MKLAAAVALYAIIVLGAVATINHFTMGVP